MGNHGWGMREMIIYLCVFAIILIFVAFSINSLYKRMERDMKDAKNNQPTIVEPVQEEKPKKEPVVEQPRAVDYTYYHNLEAKLYEATYQYLINNPTEIGSGILKIEANSLINLGFMDKMYNDNKTSECTGYSNVYVQEGSTEYTIKSYVRCDNYSSNGY